jgi:hypothetical protein
MTQCWPLTLAAAQQLLPEPSPQWKQQQHPHQTWGWPWQQVLLLLLLLLPQLLLCLQEHQL